MLCKYIYEYQLDREYKHESLINRPLLKPKTDRTGLKIAIYGFKGDISLLYAVCTTVGSYYIPL